VGRTLCRGRLFARAARGRLRDLDLRAMAPARRLPSSTTRHLKMVIETLSSPSVPGFSGVSDELVIACRPYTSNISADMNSQGRCGNVTLNRSETNGW